MTSVCLGKLGWFGFFEVVFVQKRLWFMGESKKKKNNFKKFRCVLFLGHFLCFTFPLEAETILLLSGLH